LNQKNLNPIFEIFRRRKEQKMPEKFSKISPKKKEEKFLFKSMENVAKKSLEEVIEK